VDAICRLSDLAHHADDIEGVDLNPFVVRTNGAAALDALIVARNPDSR
jgi:acetate---CoA ligase (ADP-forming)